MSKSKGNVVTPMALLEEHGSDGVRYWAASGRPGTDTAFDPAQMQVGRRLAIKMLNASKFALTTREPSRPGRPDVRRSTRRWTARCCGSLAALVDEATDAFEGYDYARVLQRTEAFFWRFCDDYLELVKGRRYGEQGAEARRLGQRRAGGRAVGAAAAVRAVSAVRDRGSLVVVAARDRFTRPHGRPPRSSTSLLADNSDATRQADERAYEWATEVHVRGPQAAIGGQAAAEGADHEGHRHGRGGLRRA